MLKQGGQWQQVDWQTALEYVANGLKQIKADHGAQSIGTLASPHSTRRRAVPGRRADARPGQREHRLPPAQCRVRSAFEGVRWLGTSIASLSQLQRALVIGSQPAQGPSAVRAAHAPGRAQGRRLTADLGRSAGRRRRLGHARGDTPIASPAQDWVRRAGRVAGAIGGRAPASRRPWPAAMRPAMRPRPSRQSLLGGERKAILLGNAAAHHAERRRAAGAGQLDRRADRRQRRLPHRGGQHRRRATGRRAAQATVA